MLRTASAGGGNTSAPTSPGGGDGAVGTTSKAATSSGSGVRCAQDKGARGGAGGSGREQDPARGSSKTERRRAASGPVQDPGHIIGAELRL